MRGIEELVAQSPVFAGLSREHLETISGCAQNVGFAEDELLFREGGPANTFYLIRRGRAAITVDAGARGQITIETLEAGEIVGWSWLFEPYRWQFSAVAVEGVRAVAFDGACLRGKCTTDHSLGYELMNRFAAVMIERLQNTRVQLLDVYGNAAQA